MSESSPYNPLEKRNLAESIKTELLKMDCLPLGSLQRFVGAGVYAIYYTGSFEPYEPVARLNAEGKFGCPIYVGKAIPRGGRKGGLADATLAGPAVFERLGQHAASVASATNLDIKDFWVRYLVVDDVWIPLGENMMIESFQPVWNRVIDGFGNKDPGNRRATQYKSPWDILHPGRSFAEKLADNPNLTAEKLCEGIKAYFERA